MAIKVVSLSEIMPRTNTAKERWEQDMGWVFKEPYLAAKTGDTCPVWGDEVPFKSVTVIVPKDEVTDAEYCLMCAHGGGYSRIKNLDDGRVAIRSDYQAW